MSNRRANITLGLFVLAALALGIAGVLVLGVGAAFRQIHPVETYFSESVQGLNIGSPVKYRGVEVGKVKAIGFTGVAYGAALADHPDPKLAQMVLVRLDLYPEKFRARKDENIAPALDRMIEGGLRARLAAAGLTGTAYVELDFETRKRRPAIIPAWTPAAQYLPAAPSTISRLQDQVENLFAKLDAADVGKLVSEVTTLAGELRTTNQQIQTLLGTQGGQDVVGAAGRTLDSAGQAMGEAKTLVAELRDTNRQVQQILRGPLLSEAQAALTDTRGLIGDLRDTNRQAQQKLATLDLSGVGRVVAGAEPMLKDLGVAAGKFAKLAETLDGALGGPALPRLIADTGATAAAARKAADTFNGAMRRVDRLLASGQQEIGTTLGHLETIAGNLRELSEGAKRYPSQLLFGAPPKRDETPQ